MRHYSPKWLHPPALIHAIRAFIAISSVIAQLSSIAPPGACRPMRATRPNAACSISSTRKCSRWQSSRNPAIRSGCANSLVRYLSTSFRTRVRSRSRFLQRCRGSLRATFGSAIPSSQSTASAMPIQRSPPLRPQRLLPRAVVRPITSSARTGPARNLLNSSMPRSRPTCCARA